MKRICFKATLNIQDSVKQEGGLERLELEHLGRKESFLMSLTAALVSICSSSNILCTMNHKQWFLYSLFSLMSYQWE